MGSRRTSDGDPVALVVTADAVRIEERVTGEAMQQDFIKTVTFSTVISQGHGEIFAFVSADTRVV